VPIRNSEVLAKRLPRAQLEVLPGVAHGIPFIDRDVVRRNAGLLRL
jgi:pimeloyl-ACP methyl ester carboxylesterase